MHVGWAFMPTRKHIHTGTYTAHLCPRGFGIDHNMNESHQGIIQRYAHARVS